MTDTDTDRAVSAQEARQSYETWPDTRAMPRTLFGAPLCPDPATVDAQVAFLGVPFDLGGPIRGAAFGPDGIRDAKVYSIQGFGSSYGEAAGPAGYYDIDADRQCLAGVTMADCGNVQIIPSEVERNFWRVTRTVRTIVERGPLLVVFGGDHAITPAVVRGFSSYPAIDIVHFDAHLDYNDTTQGVAWSHGSPLRRSAEMPWVRNITHVGIRANWSRGPVDDARARGNRIITMDQFREAGPEAAMALVPESDALYVTFDIDAMDPMICPGTGAPEPGGMSYFEMRSALRALARRHRVVGMDLVEVSPPLDPTGITAKTAARLTIDFLTAIDTASGLPGQHTQTT